VLTPHEQTTPQPPILFYIFFHFLIFENKIDISGDFLLRNEYKFNEKDMNEID
jgi:hypothetical protein